MVAICPLAGTDLFQVQAPVPLDDEMNLSAEGLNQMLGERTGRSDVGCIPSTGLRPMR